MEFRILGPLEVEHDGQIIGLGGPRQQAVLVALLLRAGETVRVERVIEEVWGESPPRDAVNTVHGYVFHLRRALEPGRVRGAPATVLVTDADGYRLVVTPQQIDAARFERLADHGRRLLRAGDFHGAAGTFADALALWRAPPLASFSEVPSVQVETVRLAERRLRAIEDYADALLEIEDPTAALAAVEAAIVDEPWRERLWEQRMLALYRAGRQTDALNAYETIRRQLRDELGIEPGPGLRQLHQRVLDHDPELDVAPRVTPAASQRAALPHPATSFIGRSGDRRRLVDALARHRLVTVIGPGGVGKTRLVVETLGDSSSRNEPGPTRFVDLACLDRDVHLADAVLAAIDGRTGAHANASAALESLLGTGPSTLVLDNCEHVVAAVAELVGELLACCAELRVVATSREALIVDGEQLIAISPLSVPDPANAASAEGALSFDAVELFVDRARASHRDFDPHDNIDAIITICAAVDGVPLALELAASRLRSMPVSELAERIGDRLRLLTGGPRGRMSRQQNLEATIAWSHGLLDELEATAFARLSVFVGGFDLAAAEAVISTEPIVTHDVVDLVGQLVDKSLVTLEPSSGRYRMLETIRAYATERLADHPTLTTQMRQRHARWFADTLIAHAPGLRGGGRPETIEAIDRDLANYGVALAWALEAAPAVAVTIAAELGPWWELRGLLREGREWLEAALATEAGTALERYRAWLAVGFIARRQGDHGNAVAATETALLGIRSLDEPAHLAHALGRMAWVALGAGQPDYAIELAQEGLALAETLDDESIAAWMYLGLGHAAHNRGDRTEATRLLVLARDSFIATDGQAGLGRALFHLALIALEEHDLGVALEAAADAARVTLDGHDLNGTLMAVEVAARVTSAAGMHHTAIELLAASSRLRDEVGAHDHGGLTHLDEIPALAATALSDADLAHAHAAGRALDLEGTLAIIDQCREAPLGLVVRSDHEG